MSVIQFGEINLEGEEVVYNSDTIQLKINNGEFARGTLSLTSSNICWKQDGSERGFMIPWDKITVQAITQEPQRCVYFMIDACWPESSANPANGEQADESENEDDEGNESDVEITEFWALPDSSDETDELYYVMTKFPQSEHMADDSDDDDQFFDGENIDQMNLNDSNDHYADAE